MLMAIRGVARRRSQNGQRATRVEVIALPTGRDREEAATGREERRTWRVRRRRGGVAAWRRGGVAAWRRYPSCFGGGNGGSRILIVLEAGAAGWRGFCSRAGGGSDAPEPADHRPCLAVQGQPHGRSMLLSVAPQLHVRSGPVERASSAERRRAARHTDTQQHSEAVEGAQRESMNTL